MYRVLDSETGQWLGRIHRNKLSWVRSWAAARTWKDTARVHKDLVRLVVDFNYPDIFEIPRSWRIVPKDILEYGNPYDNPLEFLPSASDEVSYLTRWVPVRKRFRHHDIDAVLENLGAEDNPKYLCVLDTTDSFVQERLRSFKKELSSIKVYRKNNIILLYSDSDATMVRLSLNEHMLMINLSKNEKVF